MGSQNITPNKKLNIPNTQILPFGYLPSIPIEIKLPIPKISDNINEITAIIVFVTFII
jgi:hypothetical protein